jgi:hypothetical protein
MVVYLCVLIVFLLHRESLKLILIDEPLREVVLSHHPGGKSDTRRQCVKATDQKA